jgi:DNA-3-methyladenine glycosylase II
MKKIAPKSVKEAQKHLSKTDKKFKKFIQKNKFESWKIESHITPYQFLARSIIYQQLSGKAASAIYKKFLLLFDKKKINFKKLRLMTDPQLRAAGVSAQKAKYLRDLAHHVEVGLLPAEDLLFKMEDALIIEKLTLVKGIGVWTVQMMLIFYFKRIDIFPSLDLGVKKGYQVLFQTKALPETKELDKVCEKWSPFKSIAALYLWRAADQNK